MSDIKSKHYIPSRFFNNSQFKVLSFSGRSQLMGTSFSKRKQARKLSKNFQENHMSTRNPGEFSDISAMELQRHVLVIFFWNMK